jgi:Mn-containing catalase
VVQRLFYFFIVFFCRYEVVAEQKARAVYDNILRLSDDPDVNEVIKFLRQREVVHFQRFGEALDNLQSKLQHKQVKGTGIKECK